MISLWKFLSLSKNIYLLRIHSLSYLIAFSSRSRLYTFGWPSLDLPVDLSSSIFFSKYSLKAYSLKRTSSLSSRWGLLITSCSNKGIYSLYRSGSFARASSKRWRNGFKCETGFFASSRRSLKRNSFLVSLRSLIILSFLGSLTSI